MTKKFVVMITITPVDMQCNILILHLYLVSFLLLLQDEWNILIFNSLNVKNIRYEEFVLNIVINQMT